MLTEIELKRRDNRIRRQLRTMRKQIEALEGELATEETPVSLRDKAFDQKPEDRARIIAKLRRQGIDL